MYAHIHSRTAVRNVLLVAVAILIGLALAAAALPFRAQALSTKSSTLAGCLPYFDTTKYRNHEYEVCSAYVANSATVALQGFYKFGNDDISYLAGAAQHHFETRYWEGARQKIENEVSTWLTIDSYFGNSIHQNVRVLSLSSSLAADRAVLQTQESWLVTDSWGDVLLSEPLHTQYVTMCRGKLPGHLLHEWMVVSFTSSPSYDCMAFNMRNGITP